MAVLPVEDDHALHAQAIDEDRAPVAHAVRIGRVVVGDGAADHDPAEKIHAREREIQDLAADVVEVDVDAFRARILELLAQTAGLVVDAGIEAELFLHVAAFLAAAGDADSSRAPELGELPDYAADRARR